MNGEFKNPHQDPGSEKRLLLVFVLTFAVLIIFQPLLMKYIKPQQQAPAKQEQQQQQPASTPAPPPATTTPAAPANASATAAVPAKQAAAEQETVVENDLYKITFTNRGAQVKSWILKKFQADPDSGKPLDLVNAKAAPQFGYPLSLWTYDEGLRKKLNEALYVVTTSESWAPFGRSSKVLTRTVTFEYSEGAISVRKAFTFDLSTWEPNPPPADAGAAYVVKVETSVTQNGAIVRAFPAWPAGFGDQTNPAGYASSRVDYEAIDKVQRLDPKKVSGGATINGPFNWAGALDQYFAAAFIPDDPNSATLVTLHNTIEIQRDPEKPDSQKDKYPVLGIAVGNVNGPTTDRLFVGPKNLNVLEAAKVGQGDLRGLIDFGFWSFISRPLFLWLRWTQQHVASNWGVAIIILTVIINLVLFPLRLTSMKSALKMQKMQPQVNGIKEKYKQKGKNLPARDPRKLELTQQQNQEIAALFKREGANPVGGCLPMLIQFPFLIAFYTMLGTTVELRHAHFLWLRDLSSPDPYHIIPITIILSTLLVQKMTPQAGMDPAQQKMMTFMMPIMLGVISWSLSSGLGVYWIVGNIIMIIQQYWMNNSTLGREMRAEAEKRAAKKNK
jgi:YidC/Oxa1 family membrane protein insertase